MTIPDPNNLMKWLDLTERVLGRIVAPGKRSKKRRYRDLKELYDIISDIYIDYAQMFDQFDSEVPFGPGDQGEYITRSEIIEENSVPELVQNAKKEFNKNRKRLSADRLLWKDKAAGWFGATEDQYERRFLFAAYWFLEYRDDYNYAPIFSDAIIDFNISSAIESGGSATFDTPSQMFALKIMREEEPSILREESDKMRTHLSGMFRLVVQKFRVLEETWQVTLD